MKKVLLIIPAYNEEESISQTLDSIKDYCANQELPFQLDWVIVNDGSQDKTKQIVQLLRQPLLNLSANLGLSGAFMAGMRFAWESSYDYVIQFDADGQHLPQYIPDLVQMADQGVNIVIGSRFVTEKRPKSMRMIGNFLISSAIRLSTGQKISDPTSGMRLFDKDAIAYYVHHLDMSPEPETVSYLIKKGFIVKECQVSIAERTGGKSYLNVRRSLHYMFRVAVSILILQPFRK